MIWTDDMTTIAKIEVYADKYDPADTPIQVLTGPFTDGDEVTASGYVAANAPNDVDWVLFYDDGDDNPDAISRFHR